MQFILKNVVMCVRMSIAPARMFEGRGRE